MTKSVNQVAVCKTAGWVLCIVLKSNQTFLSLTNNDVLRIHEREIIPGKVCFLGGHQE